MTIPEGAFYSAEDADSLIDPERPDEKGEGAFYIWTQIGDLNGSLGEHAGELGSRLYGVRNGGNVDNDPHGEFAGQEHPLSWPSGRARPRTIRRRPPDVCSTPAPCGPARTWTTRSSPPGTG